VVCVLAGLQLDAADGGVYLFSDIRDKSLAMPPSLPVRRGYKRANSLVPYAANLLQAYSHYVDILGRKLEELPVHPLTEESLEPHVFKPETFALTQAVCDAFYALQEVWSRCSNSDVWSCRECNMIAKLSLVLEKHMRLLTPSKKICEEAGLLSCYQSVAKETNAFLQALGLCASVESIRWIFDDERRVVGMRIAAEVVLLSSGSPMDFSAEPSAPKKRRCPEAPVAASRFVSPLYRPVAHDLTAEMATLQKELGFIPIKDDEKGEENKA